MVKKNQKLAFYYGYLLKNEIIKYLANYIIYNIAIKCSYIVAKVPQKIDCNIN